MQLQGCSAVGGAVGRTCNVNTGFCNFQLSTFLLFLPPCADASEARFEGPWRLHYALCNGGVKRELLLAALPRLA